jgi:malate synthase
MKSLKEELVKATVTFEATKIINESEVKGIDQIAKELNTTKQNIFRALQNGMDKIYKQMKKDNKATPAQAIKILMDFWNADAEEIISYLGKENRAEIEAYVREHGAD